ncbi:MAG: phenylacetate--CoA ligase family protein [Candidatus Thermoplasmatota archaeon]|nr:phenylacetate--CoA ligase family protein [Candidatus Thermoplasmatota archaeon]
MNPFFNPVTALPLLKNYFFDKKRLERQDPQKIKKIRDAALRRTLRYAETVPLYHDKFSACGLQVEDIRGAQDITKVPLVKKQDLLEHFPSDLLPRDYDRRNVRVISTSGSTGKPVSLYTDFSVFSGGIGALVRPFDQFHVNWRTSRIANIGNFNPNMADSVADTLFYSKASFVYRKDRRLSLNAFLPTKQIVSELNRFKADVIYSYPATLFQLAHYKRKGSAENINPKAFLVSGSVLEPYTRAYVEEAFGCKMFNLYESVESLGAPMAFECSEGTWHINYDFFHLEAINENGELVENGKRGHIVVTRLYGKATPIVRYTGMDDWVILSEDEDCSCGLRTPVLKEGVEGRRSDSVVLPDGRLFPGPSFAMLYQILNDLKTRKVKQFQIVQKKIDEIDILVVIDEDLRHVGPSIELIFETIKDIHQKKTGPGVQINVKEVKEIPSQKNKPAPIVVSLIRPEKGFKVVDD